MSQTVETDVSKDVSNVSGHAGEAPAPRAPVPPVRSEVTGKAASPKREAGGIVKKILPLIILAVAAGGVYGLSHLPSRAHDVERVPPPPVNVEVMTIHTILPGGENAGQLRDVYEQSGTVSPRAVVSVSAEVSGAVREVHKRKGDVVTAGEPLAALDTELIDAEIQAIQANVKLLEANIKGQEANIRGLAAKAAYDRVDLERVRELHSANAARIFELNVAETTLEGSEAAVDGAKAGLEAAKASAEAARASLLAAEARRARAAIKAPVDGVLDGPLKGGDGGVGRDIEVGDFLSPGQALCSVVDVSTVKVAVDIPEQDVPAYAVGQTHEIEVGTFGFDPTRRVEATITYVSRIADSSAHTTRMELSIPNSDGRLHSGQMVTVRLTRRVLEEMIRIPLDAVIPLENGKAVYVAEDVRRDASGHTVATARWRLVTLGMFSGQKDIQILSGLSEGDVLILPQGNRYVSDGQGVRIK